MSRGWIDLNELEDNLQQSYRLLLNIVGESEHFEVEEAMGYIAKSIALIQGDLASIDEEAV